jgi:spore coat protein H
MAGRTQPWGRNGAFVRPARTTLRPVRRAALSLLLALGSGAFMSGPLACAAEPSTRALPEAAAGADLFTGGRVPLIRIELGPSQVAALREAPRTYVRGRISDGSNTLGEVGIHLKGSKGSFRGVDDNPSFTLSFDHFKPGQRFHGLRKIHLNNSVEDPSLVNESLGSELFRRAGVPAPRVGHAHVQLNGRKLGLHVLKEGFTEDFLALHFQQTGGNLYEPIEGSDVNNRMERDSGAGPDEQKDLEALAAAALEPDLPRRWQQLQAVLDVDRFLSFLALEVLLGHRDGYCLARNNFRVYHDLDTGKMVFLPHGMDVLLGSPDLPLQPHMAGLVARAVMETAEGRSGYRGRVASVFTNVFNVAALTSRVDQLVLQLRPALRGSAGRDLVRQAEVVKARITVRAAGVARQLAQPEPQPLRFENGLARPGPWQVVDAPAGGTLDQVKAPDGRPALHIRAGPVTAASWRTTVWLGRGRYRFEGQARIAGVTALPYGRNEGAGLRVAGARQPQPHRFTGDSPWKNLTVDFEVASPLEAVELSCELRASHGEAWFDLESLRLLRMR